MFLKDARDTIYRFKRFFQMILLNPVPPLFGLSVRWTGPHRTLDYAST